MSRPFLRVDLSSAATDLTPQIIETGMPALDKWNAGGTLLGEWLGRLAAESLWEGESVCYYVRDDDGLRLGDVKCVPATRADLDGPLAEELDLLKQRLNAATPQSASGRKLHQFVSRGLLDPQPGADVPGLNYHWFKYRDVSGAWRLVWCCGYQPVQERAMAASAICAGPDCRQLSMVNRGATRRCPRCGARVPKRAFVTRHWKGLVATLLLLLAVGGGGYYWKTRPNATLTCHVVRAADGQPVPDAEIRIAEQARYASTDSQGSVRFERLRGPNIALKLSPPGYRSQSLQVEIASGEEGRVDVQLVGSGKIEGTVVHAADSTVPVADAQIAIAGFNGSTPRSDADGHFTLPDVPPGPVDLQVTATGFRAQEVAAQADQQPLNVPLAGNANLSGTVVRGDTNQPVADAEVVITGTPFETRTDSNGQFHLSAIRGGATQVVVTVPGMSAMVDEQLPADQDTTAQIVLRGGATVSGEITSGLDGRPLPGVSVVVAGTELQTTTDVDGQFSLPGIAAGEATFLVSADGFRPMELTKQVTDGRQQWENLTLTPSITIRGSVVRAIDGHGLEGAMVAIAETRATAQTDQDGQFRFVDVSTLPVRLGVRAAGFRDSLTTVQTAGTAPLQIALTGDAVVVGTVVRGDTKQPVADAEVHVDGTPLKTRTDAEGKFRLEGVYSGPIQIAAAGSGLAASVSKTLPPGEETDVQLVLTGGATISGRVIGALDRQPLAGATVSIGETSLSAVTDEQGRFALTGVPPSQTTMRVTSDGFAQESVIRQLTPGDQPLGDIPLAPLAEIAGRILRTWDGAPVADALVTLGEQRAQTRTDGEGTYAMSAVPAGQAVLHVSADGYRSQAVERDLLKGQQTLEDISLVGDTSLGGVTVDAADRQRVVPNAQVQIQVAGQRRTVTSDEEGRFTVGDVPAGLAQVAAAAEGYRNAYVQQQVTASAPRIEVPMTRLLTMRGVVVDADSRRRTIAGAQVHVDVGGVAQTVTSGADGRFSVSVPLGDANIYARASGYANAAIQQPLTSENAPIEVPMTRLAPAVGSITGIGTESGGGPGDGGGAGGGSDGESSGGSGGSGMVVDSRMATNLRQFGEVTLRGTVINAIDKEPVPNARVDVNVLGDRQYAYTDRRGRFAVVHLRRGLADVAISKIGFEPMELTHLVDGETPLLAVISPVLPEGVVRIVLTWAERPRDLDSHLFDPRGTHLSFKDPVVPGATLDVDAKEGWGPETITIHTTPGSYRYYVSHPENIDTTDGTGLARSEAEVRVYYRGDSPKKPIRIPVDARRPVWYGFDIYVTSGRRISVVPRGEWSATLPER